jgi:hypothetical protein
MRPACLLLFVDITSALGTFVISSWLQTASAGFPNWKSCDRRGFGKAKPAVMCRTRCPQYSILHVFRYKLKVQSYKMYTIQSYRINRMNTILLVLGRYVKKKLSTTIGMYLSARGWR